MLIARTDLILSVKANILRLVGLQACGLENHEDIRSKYYWTDDLEKDFQEELNQEMDVTLDLSELKPLTLNKIADEIGNREDQSVDPGDIRFFDLLEIGKENVQF